MFFLGLAVLLLPTSPRPSYWRQSAESNSVELLRPPIGFSETAVRSFGTRLPRGAPNAIHPSICVAHCRPSRVSTLRRSPNRRDVAKMIRALEGYEGTLIVRSALRLAPLVFVRPGELRHAQWADIDLEAAEWRFTVTKTDTDHIVPLASSHPPLGLSAADRPHLD